MTIGYLIVRLPHRAQRLIHASFPSGIRSRGHPLRRRAAASTNRALGCEATGRADARITDDLKASTALLGIGDSAVGVEQFEAFTAEGDVVAFDRHTRSQPARNRTWYCAERVWRDAELLCNLLLKQPFAVRWKKLAFRTCTRRGGRSGVDEVQLTVHVLSPIVCP